MRDDQYVEWLRRQQMDQIHQQQAYMMEMYRKQIPQMPKRMKDDPEPNLLVLLTEV